MHIMADVTSMPSPDFPRLLYTCSLRLQINSHKKLLFSSLYFPVPLSSPQGGKTSKDVALLSIEGNNLVFYTHTGGHI